MIDPSMIYYVHCARVGPKFIDNGKVEWSFFGYRSTRVVFFDILQGVCFFCSWVVFDISLGFCDDRAK